MGDPFRDHALPRGPLLAAALLLGSALLAVATVRVTGIGASVTSDAPAVSERALRFEDRGDGSIAVFDAASNRQVDSVAPGTNGFVRGTLRGLARERKREGIGPEAPFQLIGRADGRLTLVDPATGRRVDLESFGPTNAAAFSQMLVAGSAAR
jgi:putative photosynthetic complex assembly protein